MKNEKRVIGFDVLKIIAAFFVICIHQKFPGEFGLYFTAIARFSVPIFILITGYFFCDSFKKNKVDSQIIKIIKLILFAYSLYFFVLFIDCLIRNIDILNYLKSIYTFKNILKLLFFNASILRSHLWYLLMILYVLVIMKYIYKTRFYKVICYCTPLLLILSLVLNQYSLLFFKHQLYYIYVRNFIFVGLPYFCIGDLIRKYNEKILLIKKNTLYIGSAISILFIVLERYFLVKYSFNYEGEYYIGSFFLSIFLFLLSFNIRKDTIFAFLATIGLKYSNLIYIIHYIPIFIITTYKFDIYLPFYKYIGPFYIFIFALFLSKFFLWIKFTIKKE